MSVFSRARGADPVCVAFALVLLAACDAPPSATDLHPKGPPKIMQVRMTETYMAGSSFSTRPVFAFGTYPTASNEEQHPVSAATPVGNKFRIIMSELLRGNRIEEIECRFNVDDDNYEPVPDGTTPDDIARCSQAQDLLPTVCKGSNPHSVCLCQKDDGCPSGTDEAGNPIITPKGESVGVMDKNQDGAVDDTQLIAGAVGLKCGDIDVPIDQGNSYWNPSGNQLTPAMGGFDALGPAIVLSPVAPDTQNTLLPTNLDCTFTFADTVVDKDDNLAVCAPPDGDYTLDCTPGDVSLTKFHTEALRYSTVSPDQGATGVSRTDAVVINANTFLDMSTLSTITIIQGASTSFTAFTVTLMSNKIIVITPTAATGFAANTMYTVTIPVTVKDTFHQPAPAPFVLTFTTGA